MKSLANSTFASSNSKKRTEVSGKGTEQGSATRRRRRSRVKMFNKKRSFHRVKIIVDVPSGDIVDQVNALNAAMFQVLQGQKLIEVETVSYRDGKMTLLIEADPRKFCFPSSAAVRVEVEPFEPVAA